MLQRIVKVIFISSGGTIYKNNLVDHKEIEDLNPINFYGKSKVVIEKNLKDLHNNLIYDISPKTFKCIW